MASATGSQLITAVKDHLGDRASGYIGSQSVDNAAMSSINRALLRICTRYSLEALQRNTTVAVTSSTNVYALPTTIGAETIRIKNLATRPVTVRGSETTGVPMERLSIFQRDTTFPYTNNSRTGRPLYYTIFNSQFELEPWPDTTYTMYLRLNIWPTSFTSGTLAQSHQLGEEWDQPIEEFATFDCFAKLQQTADAQLWLGMFRESFRELIKSMNLKPDSTLGYSEGVSIPLVSESRSDFTQSSVYSAYSRDGNTIF